jgi:hypothetical protein
VIETYRVLVKHFHQIQMSQVLDTITLILKARCLAEDLHLGLVIETCLLYAKLLHQIQMTQVLDTMTLIINDKCLQALGLVWALSRLLPERRHSL